MKIPFTKINNIRNLISPDTIGYIRPDNVINFKTPKIAHHYAKNKALQGYFKNKAEYGVIVKDNKILKEFFGEKNQINIPKEDYSLFKDADFIHSHPDNAPLSFPDFAAANILGIKRIYAYTTNNKFSTLEKLPPERYLKILPKFLQSKIQKSIDKQNYNKMVNKYSNTYANTISSKEYKNFISYFNKMGYKKLNRLEKFIYENFVANKIGGDAYYEIDEIMSKIAKNGTLNKISHDFWTKNSSKYGYKYTSNIVSKDCTKS